MPLRLVFQNLFCPMGSGGQLGLYSEYFPEEETERVEGKKKEEKKSDKQTREFGFKRHKKKKKTQPNTKEWSQNRCQFNSRTIKMIKNVTFRGRKNIKGLQDVKHVPALCALLRGLSEAL